MQTLILVLSLYAALGVTFLLYRRYLLWRARREYVQWLEKEKKEKSKLPLVDEEDEESDIGVIRDVEREVDLEAETSEEREWRVEQESEQRRVRRVE